LIEFPSSPVNVAGDRVFVACAFVLRIFWGAGASHREILEDYPMLEEGDILESLEWAAAQTDHAILISHDIIGR